MLSAEAVECGAHFSGLHFAHEPKTTVPVSIVKSKRIYIALRDFSVPGLHQRDYQSDSDK